MGRKKGFKKAKDKFDKLAEEFKDAVQQSSTDEIRKRISEIAILDFKEREVLKLDGAVNNAKSELKNLMEPYRENFKSYKLQIAFCNKILDDKGGGAAVKADEDDQG